MKINEAIAKRIQELLDEKKLTQYRVALNAGLHHATLSAVLRGQYNGVNIKTVYSICQGLDITIGEFFTSPIFSDENIEW